MCPTTPLKGSFGCAIDPSARPHTLILGTQPSDVSLGANRYYDTHTNALWHIAGDALGFRRGWLDGKGRAPPPSITRSVLHTRVVDTYEEALALLLSRGYGLWDVIAESERVGSLDGDIKNARPADIRGLVEQHPSISTLCFASGSTTAAFFKTHFRTWLLEDGAFGCAPDPLSQRAFGKLVKGAEGAIQLVVMESVSPAYVPRVAYGDAAEAKRHEAFAHAGYPLLTRRASAYAWKRQQWLEDCFHRELSSDELALRFGERPGDFHDEPPRGGIGAVPSPDSAPCTLHPPATPARVTSSDPPSSPAVVTSSRPPSSPAVVTPSRPPSSPALVTSSRPRPRLKGDRDAEMGTPTKPKRRKESLD